MASLVKFGARGVMPEGFAVGTRVRLSPVGRRQSVWQKPEHLARTGRVCGASKDGRCAYVVWDGHLTRTAYLAAYLERLDPIEAPR